MDLVISENGRQIAMGLVVGVVSGVLAGVGVMILMKMNYRKKLKERLTDKKKNYKNKERKKGKLYLSQVKKEEKKKIKISNQSLPKNYEMNQRKDSNVKTKLNKVPFLFRNENLGNQTHSFPLPHLDSHQIFENCNITENNKSQTSENTQESSVFNSFLVLFDKPNTFHQVFTPFSAETNISSSSAYDSGYSPTKSQEVIPTIENWNLKKNAK